MPKILPEFALKVTVDDFKMVLKIIWVYGDSFGLSVYYPVEQFGKEFDDWIKEYLVD